jgi:hypothetical protein
LNRFCEKRKAEAYPSGLAGARTDAPGEAGNGAEAFVRNGPEPGRDTPRHRQFANFSLSSEVHPELNAVVKAWDLPNLIFGLNIRRLRPRVGRRARLVDLRFKVSRFLDQDGSKLRVTG